MVTIGKIIIGRTVLCLAAIAGAVLGQPGRAQAAEQTPPNVLLIYVDDLGYGDLASYGHPVIRTPALDALAAQGARLTSYYAPSALCSPSRAGLLTGRFPYRSGIRSWIPPDSGIFLQDEEHTLAEALADRGYDTALFGKWHLNSDLGSPDEPQPQDQGFAAFYGHNAYQIPTNRSPRNVYRGRQLLPPQTGYTAQLYVDEALSWLKHRNPANPFFLMLSMAEPHTTIENPPSYNARYRAFTNGPIVPIPSGEPEPPWALLVPRGPGEYYANISYMDSQLGRLLDALYEAGLDEQTLVIFASDNGPVTTRWQAWHEVNAHGSTGGLRGRKHYLYEGGIRVPAIVRLPGVVPAGSTVSDPITGLDWFPTIMALTRQTAIHQPALDGQNVLPALKGKPLPDRTLFWAMEGRGQLAYAIRRGPWKLLLDRTGNPRELYQLDKDPLELSNQLQRAPKIRDSLTDRFRKIQATLPPANDLRFQES